MKDLNQKQIARILRLYKAGHSSYRIAEEYGVTSVTICRLLRSKRVQLRGRGRYPRELATAGLRAAR